MSEIFPKPIRDLPEADIPIDGIKAYLSQSDSHQIIFMEFEKDIKINEHSHESQWEIVLDGKVDLKIEGKIKTYKKGDRFFIPRGKKHSAKVFSGYTSVVFFNQRDRYKKKK